MPLLSSPGVALPPNARPDLATQEIVVPPNTIASVNPLITVPGEEIHLPVAYSMQLLTTVTVGNRQVYFTVQDSQGRNIFTAPAPIVQPASTFYNYHWVGNVSAAYSSVGGIEYMAPLPPIAVMPTYRVGLLFGSIIDGNDQINFFRYTYIRVPTGPRAGSPFDPARVAPAPTPLVV